MEWLSAWMRTGRGRAIATLGAVGVLGLAGATVALTQGSDGESKAAAPEQTAAASATSTATGGATSAATATPTVYTHFGILDGVGMNDEEWAKRKDQLPLAVMFDNAEQAFPHDGLHRADVVYEAFVEGGITRLMAVYWRQDADYLEPVRSARTPFVVWADELGALYAHAGSATTANEANASGQIYEWGIKDLDAFGPIAGKYHRNPDRRGPHDVGTSTRLLREGAASLGFTGPPAFEPWLFRDAKDPSPAGEKAEGLEIDFGGSRRAQWQTVQYRWDAATKSYARYQYGGPHVDARSKEQLRFTTVVAMRALYQVVDDAGHVLIDQVGAGTATIFTDGKAVQVTWKKPSREGRTRFYDGAGNEIHFARGPIFIEVLGPASALLVKAAANDLPELPPYVAPPPFVPEPETPTPAPTATSTRPATPTRPAGSVTAVPSASSSASASPSASATTAGSPSASSSAGVTETATPPVTP